MTHRTMGGGAVLQLLPVLDAGGAQTVAGDLAVGLAAAGVESHIAGLIGNRADHPWLADMEARGVTVHRVSAPPRRYAQETAQVARIAHRIGASVVHSHTYRADVIAWRVPDRPFAHVITAHGFTGGGWRNRAYEAFGRWLMARADATIAVSAALESQLRAAGVRPERLHRIANVLTPPAAESRAAARAALGLPADAVLVGFVGRFGREKGADQLLAACGALPVGTQVVLVGDGPERPALEALAAALPSGMVHFAGLVPAAGRYLRAFDVVCLPSRTEGTPMVLLEALAAGVPAVAFGVGGIPDVLRDATEFLVPPGDVPALAARLTAVLGDRTGAAARAEAVARQRAAAADPSAWVAAHQRVYAGVMRGAPGA